MKKTVLLLLMMVFLLTNLYAEEFHYHEDLWCLKPDGTPKGRIVVREDGSINMVDDDGDTSIDRYIKESLQTVYEKKAISRGIPIQIPSTEMEYHYKISDSVAALAIVEPISATQIYMYTWQEGDEAGEDHILMTYDPFTKITRYTACQHRRNKF